jgi:hypothetical protein
LTRTAVLREFPINLFPEVRVCGEGLRFLFPQKLQRMTQTQIVDDLLPVDLRHPYRVGSNLRLIG